MLKEKERLLIMHMILILHLRNFITHVIVQTLENKSLKNLKNEFVEKIKRLARIIS
jgi:hypothetical protein